MMLHRFPTVARLEQGDAAWLARAEWDVYAVTRWGSSPLKARINALRGVVFYRLLQPFSRRWSAQARRIWPRWYDWLVN